MVPAKTNVLKLQASRILHGMSYSGSRYMSDRDCDSNTDLGASDYSDSFSLFSGDL